jgi:hypothetical protein
VERLDGRRIDRLRFIPSPDAAEQSAEEAAPGRLAKASSRPADRERGDERKEATRG